MSAESGVGLAAASNVGLMERMGRHGGGTTRHNPHSGGMPGCPGCGVRYGKREATEVQEEKESRALTKRSPTHWKRKAKKSAKKAAKLTRKAEKKSPFAR